MIETRLDEVEESLYGNERKAEVGLILEVRNLISSVNRMVYVLMIFVFAVLIDLIVTSLVVLSR